MSMVWPVYGHCPRETLAMFFTWGDAVDFAIYPTRYGAEQRNLYVGVPEYHTNPIAKAMDTIVDRQLQRHSQLIKDAETLKKENDNARE